jgi:hypothetical protein
MWMMMDAITPRHSLAQRMLQMLLVLATGAIEFFEAGSGEELFVQLSDTNDCARIRGEQNTIKIVRLRSNHEQVDAHRAPLQKTA